MRNKDDIVLAHLRNEWKYDIRRNSSVPLLACPISYWAPMFAWGRAVRSGTEGLIHVGATTAGAHFTS